MKKRNGMTLIEIIVSMAVFAVIAMLLVEIMSSVNAMMRSTAQLNKRLSYEAKYADNLQIQASATANPVDYVIRYDIRPTGGAKEINSSGSSRQAFEYAVQYEGTPIVGEDMHRNVNYRFMTFKKINMVRPSYPGEIFYLYLKPVAYFTGSYSGSDANMKAQFKEFMTPEQITKAEADAASVISGYTKVAVTQADLADGTTSKTIATSGNLTLNHLYEIQVKNCPEVIADDVMNVSGKIKFEVNKNFNLNGTQEKKFADSTVTYYMYSKIGSVLSSQSNATFYKECTIQFNVNTGAFYVGESIPAD